MLKPAPPPPVSPETWRALLAAAAEFVALKPWEFAYDSDALGLIDPGTGETRIGQVLGNAGEVFAAVFYRRNGLRWILAMLGEDSDPEDLNTVEGMECLKLEFVAKRELWKEDLALLKAAGFNPLGKGPVWPQFRSSEPGWLPWHINQAEADRLLADLPRLTAFLRMFGEHPALYDDREPTEIPFLPATLPDRPLTPADLDWRPLLPLPVTGFEPFHATEDQVEKLRALPQSPDLVCEFDCTLVPGGAFQEGGRPCFGRYCLLVERQHGLILGLDVLSGALGPGEAAGRGLVTTLLMAKALPAEIRIGGSRPQPVLQPICDVLGIRLLPASSLPVLEEALEALAGRLAGR
jgi:hypothetical protein